MKKIIVIVTTTFSLLGMDVNNNSLKQDDKTKYSLKENFNGHDFCIQVHNNTGTTQKIYSYVGSNKTLMPDKQKELINKVLVLFSIDQNAEFFIITNHPNYPAKKPSLNANDAKIIDSHPGSQLLMCIPITEGIYKGIAFVCPENKNICGGIQYFTIPLTAILGTNE